MGNLRFRRFTSSLALTTRNWDIAQKRGVVQRKYGKCPSFFRKARWVPLSASTCQALQQYLDRRLRINPRSPDSPLLLNQRSRRLHHVAVNRTFRQLLSRCAIPPGEHAAPRIHDLRHTFAVHRLLAWYRDGADVNARLPWLATYLGHVDIHSTQVYLRATPELTEEVARRFHDYYLQQTSIRMMLSGWSARHASMHAGETLSVFNMALTSDIAASTS